MEQDRGCHGHRLQYENNGTKVESMQLIYSSMKREKRREKTMDA
jgi:hypothetical protein